MQHYYTGAPLLFIGKLHSHPRYLAIAVTIPTIGKPSVGLQLSEAAHHLPFYSVRFAHDFDFAANKFTDHETRSERNHRVVRSPGSIDSVHFNGQ